MRQIDPLRIDVINMNNKLINKLPVITTMEIFTSATNVFHPDGLFSNDIYGVQGSDTRITQLATIILNIPVFHPIIYKQIIRLKKLYEGIISCKEYAVWDEKIGDFTPSVYGQGETGMTFFIKHFLSIKFSDNKSVEREHKIKLIKKYTKGVGISGVMIDRLIVIPAGLRDYVVDATTPSEHEINPLYRSVMTATNTIRSINMSVIDKSTLDPSRYRIQKSTFAVYEFIFSQILDGKEGFIQEKYLKRAIDYGTRNVLTSIPTDIEDATTPKYTVNHSICGLLQYIKAKSPVFKFLVRDHFLSKLLVLNSSDLMVSKKTMSTIDVVVSDSEKKYWLGNDGLDTIINKFAQEALRDLPIEIENMWLMLVYDDGKTFYPIYDTREQQTIEILKEHVRPITYTELFYLSVENDISETRGLVTRYPILGKGSIYPCKVYVMTTTTGRKMRYINSKLGIDKILHEMPVKGKNYMNSISVDDSKIRGLSADFDGDKVVLTIVMVKDSIEEINNLMNDPKFYVDGGGSITSSNSIPVVNLALTVLTGKG